MLLNDFRSHIASQFPVRGARLSIALLASTALAVQPLAGGVAFAGDILPTGGQVVSGQVAIGTSGAGMTVTQGSDKAIVNWNGFSVGQGNSVNFVQPNSSSAILNRVTGSANSTIAGSITGNGQVYLINPNGIAITRTGTVNVTSGFVASTLDTSDDDFLKGRYDFTGNGASAAASNEGIVTVGRGGYAALIGGTVRNDGMIAVPMGKVGLGSGERATLDLSGDGFLQVALPTRSGAEGTGALIENSGTISAEGGTAVMRAATARNAARHAVNLSGSIEADSVSGSDGEIVIGGGEGGNVTVSGKISAKSSTDKGGKITATGKSVALKNATVDASGTKGGGTVRIGGEGQTTGTAQRAQTVSLDAASTIKANATQSGKGGSVNIEANALTNLGQILATGNVGGNVTLSAGSLFNTGLMDVSGNVGAGGAVDIVVQDSYVEATAGQIRADGVTAGGSVSVQGRRIFSSGTLTARASQGVGGALTLTAADMDLVAAQLDASGATGGGQVRLGGDYQGGGTLAHANTLDISSATVIRADAITSGSGGRIIMWSDAATRFYGTATAKAGASSGNGGLIEVSSKGLLTMAGTATASAAHGARGTVLLDPKNIIISDTTGAYPHYQLMELPAGFEGEIFALSNGNVVVTDPSLDFGVNNGGGVYLFNGTTGGLISLLVGSTEGDMIGDMGVTVLTNGNFVVKSSLWHNGSANNAGAATWGSGTTGIAGDVTSTNSLVGSTASDQVWNTIALANGNYVVTSAGWDNGAVVNAGAVTWGNGTTGTSGVVSSANSLVGSSANDQVGAGVTALANGNYVVRSDVWDNGSFGDAGASTWGNGTTGVSGVVSASNSLVGSTANDGVGSGGIKELANGNYIVISRGWSNGSAVNAGAVTWVDGTKGASGNVSASNSLVGSTANDGVGNNVIALSNGNYVVGSSTWNNGSVVDAGAVTWGNGATGVVGVITATNSLVGSKTNDRVGSNGITALTNGNYVVASSNWDLGQSPLAVADAGAVTWGDGTTGTVGVITATNSLVGSNTSDRVGSNGITALTNGNYVVASSNWDNVSATDAGAVTWGNGTTGTVGVITATNSLVGSKASDAVGVTGITALTNGNYVVRSANWDRDTAIDAGAATWGNGTTGISGFITSANSLVGSTANDKVGTSGVTALTNGNYVVISSLWDGEWGSNVGAVTWGNGTTGISGVITADNSLLGSSTDDGVGNVGVMALSNGNYVIRSSLWDNGSVSNVGALTWGDGTAGISGNIKSSNSLIGSTANDMVGSTGVVLLTNGNYVVRSSGWTNGSMANAGAVTWGNGTIGTSGVVTAHNSLVGSKANDSVGSHGVTALANGNYIVSSLLWDNGSATDAGAVTVGNGVTGTSGAITSQNSLLGMTSRESLRYEAASPSANIFIARNETGQLYAGLMDINAANGGLTFGRATGKNVTLTSAALTSILNSGTNLSLQASNDILVQSAVISSGDGSLTLSAGRSIIVTANISLDRNLTLLANAPQSDGVIEADREAGAAVIDTSSATLTLGRTFTATMGTGAGRAENTSGNIRLGAITAGAVQVNNQGPTAGTATELSKNIVTTGKSGNQTYQGALLITGSDVRLDAGGQINWTGQNTSSISATTAGNKITFIERNVTTRIGVLDANDAARLAIGGGNVSRAYGNNNDALGAPVLTAGTLRSGDTLATLLAIGPTVNWLGAAADATSNAGSTFNFELSGADAELASSAKGYFLDLAPVSGSLTITRAQLTVTADNGSMVYGDNATNLGYTISGWKNGQTDSLLTAVTVVTNATSSSNVGTNYVTAVNAPGSLLGPAAGNYDVSYQAGTFSITQAALTVTAGNGSMIYGDQAPNLGYSVSGWKNGQTDSLLTGVSVATNATSSSNVGTGYSTTASGGTLSGDAAGNYVVNYINGSLSVTPATLTVTANNASMVAGSTIPKTGYSVAGWKGNHTDDLLRDVATFTKADSSSPAGDYAIDASGGILMGAAAENYSLVYQTGRLTITSPVRVIPTPSATPPVANPVFTTSLNRSPTGQVTTASVLPPVVSYGAAIATAAISMTTQNPRMSSAICSLGPNFSVSCSAN